MSHLIPEIKNISALCRNVVSFWFWLMTQLHKSRKGLKITVLFMCVWQSKMLRSLEPELVVWEHLFSGTKATCSHWLQNKGAVNKAGRQVGRSREEERACLERKEWKMWEEWRMEAWLQGFSVTVGVGLQQSTVIAVYFGNTHTHSTTCCVRSSAVKTQLSRAKEQQAWCADDLFNALAVRSATVKVDSSKLIPAHDNV